MHWKDCKLSPSQIYQYINWSHANNARILEQKWRKNNPIYADGYAHAERQHASQSAVMDWLRNGVVHPSPNFAIWRDYWCWWAVLMEYAYRPEFFDSSGSDSTFQRLQKQLRIARDIALGVEPETYERREPVKRLDTPTGLPGLEFFEAVA